MEYVRAGESVSVGVVVVVVCVWGGGEETTFRGAVELHPRAASGSDAPATAGPVPAPERYEV